MTDDRSETPPAGEPIAATGRTVTGRTLVLATVGTIVLVTAVFGAVLGFLLPRHAELESITVNGATVVVSPITGALYGAVTIGCVLLTLVAVVMVASRAGNGNGG
ncbi:histidine kinase [Natrialba sp. PRR66]|uniref:histidine kinase n=1 Tax=Natrialba sp. PRR66 TaxID=3098146 RepID=UPI002B1E6D07|nr:histidine kinase [Natrialba sp. PRR66]